jgi:DNA-binding NtrC family response regulator
MKLMIVGDLKGQLVSASKIAANNGAKVFTALDTKSALNALRSGKHTDLIMVDINCNIKEFIESLDREKIYATVVACGIENDKAKIIEAIKAGAKEYIPLPPDEHLIAAVFEAVVNLAVEDEVVYQSEAFSRIIEVAKQIAPSEASVLIVGESGTGKEVVAKFIHKNSKRKGKDLISVNCAAIPENLLESELFGHEKGAFTGAIERRIGKFEQANGGTLLLDEISEMDLKLQAKLLRAIQEREIVRVGGNQVIKLDIRIIATSNRNLMDEIKKGTFREDLFYRLNVINIELPPLRMRAEDVENLANYFIEKYSKLNGLNKKYLSNEAINKLKNHEWPGNVRELENIIHRAVLMTIGETISDKEIMLINTKQPANNNEDRTLAKIEKDAIESTLKKYSGDEVKTAMVLGVSLKILRSKLNDYKIAIG